MGVNCGRRVGRKKKKKERQAREEIPINVLLELEKTLRVAMQRKMICCSSLMEKAAQVLSDCRAVGVEGKGKAEPELGSARRANNSGGQKKRCGLRMRLILIKWVRGGNRENYLLSSSLPWQSR